jgi:hypothetical protein
MFPGLGKPNRSNLFMRTTLPKVVFGAACLVLAESAFGDTYSQNIVGYINLVLRPGVNLIADQFLSAPDNSLDSILNGASSFGGLANNTTFTMWNNGAYLPLSVYSSSSDSWSINYQLNLGQGGYLTSPTLVTNTFVGQVGPYFDGSANNINWNPNYANGLQLISNPIPIAGNLDYEFFNVTGRAPVAGEVVAVLNPFTQTYTKSYFDGFQWVDQISGNPSTVVLQVAQSAWFGLGANYDIDIPSPVPEPGALALVGLGAAMLFRRQGRPRAARSS